jgi:hypothetical protein
MEERWRSIFFRVFFCKYGQVFIGYGQYNNAALLVEYGFILEDNIHNTIDLEAPQELKTLKGEKLNFIQSNYIDKG